VTAAQTGAEGVQGEVTAAVRRAAEALAEQTPFSGPSDEAVARVALDAALDIEEMARVLFESVSENRDWEARSEHVREYWRDYARAIRAAILGGAS